LDAIMGLGGWLRSIGLEQYEPAFRDNKIGSDILPKLTADDMLLGDAAHAMLPHHGQGTNTTIEDAIRPQSSTIPFWLRPEAARAASVPGERWA
jgi:hypothetical protein